MTPLTNRFAPRTSPTGLVIALLLASALVLPPEAEAQRAVRRDGGGSAAGDSSAGSGFAVFRSLVGSVMLETSTIWVTVLIVQSAPTVTGVW